MSSHLESVAESESLFSANQLCLVSFPEFVCHQQNGFCAHVALHASAQYMCVCAVLMSAGAHRLALVPLASVMPPIVVIPT